DLLPLEGTQNWRNYVNISTSRGLPLALFVQAFEKVRFSSEAAHEEGAELEIVEDGTNASHEPRQATGEADEGEHIPEIVEEFQREDEQQNHAMNDDSSYDDDDVPQNWSRYDFSKLSVNKGEAVSWEYKKNEVCIGSLYANSNNMKEAIK
ncbi:hypothetical protein PVAP13_3NG181079, partial [Panicum virgatum]